MGDGNHVIDVGIAGQNLRPDTPDREFHGGRDTLHRGRNAENVFGSDRAIVVEEAFEGIALERRLRIGHGGGEGQLVQRRGRRQAHEPFVHPAAFLDGPFCIVR